MKLFFHENISNFEYYLLTLQRKPGRELKVDKFGCLQPLKKMLKLHSVSLSLCGGDQLSRHFERKPKMSVFLDPVS